MKHNWPNRFAVCGLALIVLALLPLASCNIVGPAAYLIEGPPTVDPVHDLADVPTIVFVDDRNNVVNPVSLRKRIADQVLEDLMVKKILSQSNALSTLDAMGLAAQRDRANEVLSIEEVGKSVGARQVIYVKMEQFQDTPDGFTPRPMASGRVKVIDVEQRKRLFPREDALEPSHPFQTMTREVDPASYSTRSGRLKIFEALAQETGASVAKLFYKHEARPLGGNLNPR